MRRLTSPEFVVGAFALVGLSIIIYLSLQINDRGAVGSSAKTYVAYFDSITGMVERTPVEIAGITAGFVDSFELSGKKARIKIRLRSNIQVFENASLSLQDRGILGAKFVMLDTGSSDYALLKDGDEIKNTQSKSGFEQIAEQLSATAKTLNELIQSDEPKGALGQTIVNLRDMSDRMNEMIGENQVRIGQILANMESFSKNLDDITAENKDEIRSVLVALNDVAVSMKEALGQKGSISKAAQRLDETMASIQQIVAKVERGEGTVGKLLNDETTVEQLNTAMEGVNETLGLFKKVQLGVRYRGEFLTSSHELQNQIGISIYPSPDKYLLFELVDAPVGETNVTDTIVTSDGQVISSTQTIQTNDKILFTILFGKRFWNLTTRVGMIRSKGGLGLDYHLLKDKLLLSVEGFNFSRPNDRAHVRLYGTMVLYKHLLLTGGVDDLITKLGSRNPFVGAGLQFYDQDLKSLLGVLPAGRL